MVAFKPKKVAIAFKVLEDGDDDENADDSRSLMNINEVSVFLCFVKSKTLLF